MMILLILFSTSVHAADYTAAINASKQAILIQSGALKFKTDLEAAVQKEALRIVNPPKEALYPFVAYRIYQDRSYNLRISDKTSIKIDTYPSFLLNINF